MKKGSRKANSTTPKDQATDYARAVQAGRIAAGPYVRLACRRHLENLKNARRLGLEWRLEAAQRAIDFFRDVLTLEDGRAFVLEPFQAFIVGSLFGWYKADSFRRYRDAYVEMGKGSGKSPLAAGIGLYGLIADGEPAAEVYSAATTQDQAKILWRDADRMVTQNPELADAIAQEAGCLTFKKPGKPESVFRPVSSEHKGLDGKRVHIGLIDELHEHPNGMVVDKIKAGTKRRQNALIFRITNSGHDRTSVCWNEHDYSIKVLQGTIKNEAWFAYICALDQGDDWRDEAVWPKANPGVAVGLPPMTYLREQVATAVGMPSKENITRRLNFCEWTEQADRWLDVGVWNECAGKVAVESLAGRPCFAGLDAAATQDLCALVLLFGPDEEGMLDLAARFWIPEATLAATDSGRAEADRLLLRQWTDEGWITATPGNVTDYDLMEEQILAELAKYQLRKLAFDRWNITQLVTHLKDRLGDERVVDYHQGFLGMSAPSKDLEKRLQGGKIRHGGNPVLSWMASNIALRYGPEEQVKPDRERSKDKIDGIVALVMALGMLNRQQDDEPKPSVYESRGLLHL